AVAPVTSMQWSVEGDRLALGLGDGASPRPDGVVEITPRTGAGRFIQWPRPPSSLSWGPGGRLLAELRRELEDYVTLELRGTRTVAELAGYREASWSPDGQWILGRALTRWFALDADHPGRRVWFPVGSSRWDDAAWCCPPVPVSRVGEGVG